MQISVRYSMIPNSDKCNANWENLRWGCVGIPNDDGVRNTRISAARCYLFSCARTYNSEVTEGQFLESLVLVTTKWGVPGRVGQSYSSMVNVGCLNAQDRQSLSDAGYQFEGKSWLPYNISIHPSSGNYTSHKLTDYPNKVTQGAVSRECIY